jgi:hypothetical protein
MQEYIVKIDRNGTEFWYDMDGQHHREDDKPAVIYSNGDLCWYKNGQRHRENGPAVIYGDTQVWFRYGKRHRVDGPAVIYNGTEEYWIDDVKQLNPNDVKELTVADIEKLLGYRVKVVS